VSLQRRLLVYLLLCAPLVWAGALGVSATRARHEVNELFDSELIRLASQVQAILVRQAAEAQGVPAPASAGEADLHDFALAVWDARGRLLLVDREGARLPRRADAAGFVELALDGEPWRVYYLQSPTGEWLVASAQRDDERDELVWNLVSGQLLPWLLVLPVLLVAMAWAVREALAPLRALTTELGVRDADDLKPVASQRMPAELQPRLAAMNALFGRIAAARERERRFTADAAHELRTPLAALRAQWDVLRGATDPRERQRAEQQIGAGLERMGRLVSQMLAQARLDSIERLPERGPIDWRPVVEQAMSDVLALAERRSIELGCDWPAAGSAPFPLRGDPDLIAVLLRNLLDNAVRYAPKGSAVTLRFTPHSLAVENEGPPLDHAALARLGERFHRDEGQAEGGSGLGISIARRIAALHGLELRHHARADGTGMVAELAAPGAGAAPGRPGAP
jgi:two-component system sensor histidine kinase QseC